MLLQEVKAFSLIRVLNEGSDFGAMEFIALDPNGKFNVVNTASKTAATVSPNAEVEVIGEVGLKIDKDKVRNSILMISKLLGEIVSNSPDRSNTCDYVLDNLADIASTCRIEIELPTFSEEK